MRVKIITPLLLISTLFINIAFAATWYVTPAAAGTGNGSSWANASSSLQIIINNASDGDEVWVAQGTYNGGFSMKEGVKIYGGFTGTETTLSQRNWYNNKTILDGGNMQRVVINNNNGLTLAAVLDGFTIQNGKANNNNVQYYDGAGMYIRSSSPTISNCVFYNNNADHHGGGLFIYEECAPLIINCIFFKNSGLRGGGLCNMDLSSATIINCSFSGNTASETAGAINNFASSPKIYNCILWGNSAAFGEKEIHDEEDAAPDVQNCVIQNGYNSTYATGINIITTDPQFVNASAGDLRLLNTSAALNTGNNSLYLPNYPTLDLGNNSRVYSSTIDIGAFELQENPLPVIFGSLSAKIIDGQLIVNWSTIAEKNTRSFFIETSVDGILFTKTGEVTSKASDGISSQPLFYQFTKNNIGLASLLSLSLASLLLLPLYSNRKNWGVKFVALLTIVSVVFAASCSKKEASISEKNGKLFVRIVQIDKDGNQQMSKIIEATQQ